MTAEIKILAKYYKANGSDNILPSKMLVFNVNEKKLL